MQICIQMGKFRQPLSCMEAIQLMNNLIHQTNSQERLADFQRIRNLGSNSFQYGLVTKAWWRGFLKRHEHEIVTKRGEKFALNRSEWTTLPNIKQMYDVIFDEMLDAGVAVSLLTPMFTDFYGNPVNESECFGLKQSIKTTKTKYNTTPTTILFCRQ